MKTIELDLMLKYRYLSNLNGYRDKLLFIDTIADIENNDYTQRLHALDPRIKKDEILLEDKRINYAIVDDDIVIMKSERQDEILTTFLKVDDGSKEMFSLPLAVNEISVVDRNHYFVQATINCDAPDYYSFSDDERKAYHKRSHDDDDYLILDEYPFFFNGQGFINGTRNAGFLVDKKTLAIKRITPVTMDIESAIVDDGKIYLLANDYRSMKKMWSSIYCYDVSLDKFEMLYENRDMYISGICMVGRKLHCLAAKKTCIAGRSFYEVKEGKLTLVYTTEYMFSNSIGSDCRFGKTHNAINHNNDLYILNTAAERSLVNRFDGQSLTFITDFEGSVDDLTFVGDELYVIAMKDMNLQEIYHIGSEVKRITCFNHDVLADRYVAVPQKMSIFNVHDINGWVLKPFGFDAKKTYPAILDIHGGPKTAYGEVFYHEMQYWAACGYFVIYLNPHCSDGRGDDFSDYLKHYGNTDYEDIMKFVDEVLKRYPNIDKDRLGVTGGSYGGYMTNWIITHTDRFKCAASQRSISNRVADLYYSDYAYDTTYENGIPLDEKAIELFWDRSPLKYVDAANTPTLFLQSTEDYRCPFPEAIQIFSALKWKGIDTRLFGFKGENHELSRSGKPKHRLRRIQEITAWMDKYLKGDQN